MDNILQVAQNAVEQQVEKKIKTFSLENFESFHHKEEKGTDKGYEKVKKAAEDFRKKYEINFDIVKRPRDNKYTAKELRSSFFKFQNAVNNYLGQEVKVLYVFKDENGTYHLTTFNNAADPNHFRGKNYTQYYLKELKKELDKQECQEFVQKLDKSQNTVITRYNIAKSKLKLIAGIPLLWKMRNVWQGIIVDNEGTIAEAYANFFINKININENYPNIFPKNNKEQQVEDYAMNPYGLISVDNASGFFIGDISYEATQFAVKKENASPMKMKAVYEKIDEILKSLKNTELTPKELNDKIFGKSASNQTSALMGDKDVQNTLAKSMAKKIDSLVEKIKNEVKEDVKQNLEGKKNKLSKQKDLLTTEWGSIIQEISSNS